MKSHKYTNTLIGCVCVITSIMIIGCAVNVPLHYYRPVFTEDYSAYYQGKRLTLYNFDNMANDTRSGEYYSLDYKVIYFRPIYFIAADRKTRVTTKDFIHNYFWYAFQDALRHAGMIVSDQGNSDPSAPAMWVTLMSITDENYNVRVTVQKNDKTVFAEAYTVKEPPVGKMDRDPFALGQRAYRMTNRLIETILQDPTFRKVMTEP